ncbi:hypothetical protein M0534_08520 [Methylonatrum kenyense]|uniref:hypothetical protein n=1 Tax=Methylonatrum kenyense TaxID=455253 RepID=UPI0020BF1BF0|nr:hypothetical protein [Methylonatrum kenyense]MCK8516368.1 hypothetical protein [Methylonatrum kenyense]
MTRNPRHQRQQQHDEASNIATADLPWAVMGALALVLVVLLLLVNPVTPPVDPDDSALYITAEWDPTLPRRHQEDPLPERQAVLERDGAIIQPGHSYADVDLWAVYMDPEGGCQVVGYPNHIRQSALLRLDQDDRGWEGDDSQENLNLETVGARTVTLPQGRYMVSVHLYSTNEERLPVTTSLRVTINRDRPNQRSFSWEIPLEEPRQELGVSFQIDDEGNLVDGSMTEPRELRLATGARYNCD